MEVAARLGNTICPGMFEAGFRHCGFQRTVNNHIWYRHIQIGNWLAQHLERLCMHILQTSEPYFAPLLCRFTMRSSWRDPRSQQRKHRRLWWIAWRTHLTASLKFSRLLLKSLQTLLILGMRPSKHTCLQGVQHLV